MFDPVLGIAEMERARKWRDRTPLIPAITFPPGCTVKLIPPFGGADARCIVHKGKGEVSVYLDFDGNLGYMSGKPYWEIYPAADGDTARYLLAEADELSAGIAASIRKQNRSKP